LPATIYIRHRIYGFRYLAPSLLPYRDARRTARHLWSFSRPGAASSESSMASPTTPPAAALHPTVKPSVLVNNYRLVPPAPPRPWQEAAATFPPPGALELFLLPGLQRRRAPGGTPRLPGGTPRLHGKPSRSGQGSARRASPPSKLTFWQGALRGNALPPSTARPCLFALEVPGLSATSQHKPIRTTARKGNTAPWRRPVGCNCLILLLFVVTPG